MTLTPKITLYVMFLIHYINTTQQVHLGSHHLQPDLKHIINRYL